MLADILTPMCVGTTSANKLPAYKMMVDVNVNVYTIVPVISQ